MNKEEYIDTLLLENDRLYKENKELHNKIDKAIEYINEAELGEFEDGKIYYLKEDGVGKELLKLLKDSDVDECE